MAEQIAFTEDKAIKILSAIIHQIYQNRPIEMDVRLTAAIDEVPEVKVSYTARPNIGPTLEEIMYGQREKNEKEENTALKNIEKVWGKEIAEQADREYRKLMEEINEQK